MMIRKTIFASAAAFAIAAFAAAPAAAKDQTQRADSAGEAKAETKAEGERKTCKRFANSASRMRSEKVCLTAEGWKKFERAK